MILSTCEQTTALAPRPAGLPRAWILVRRGLNQWWCRHQEAVRLRAQMRALQELDDRTLRDLGLAERLPALGGTLHLPGVEACRW